VALLEKQAVRLKFTFDNGYADNLYSALPLLDHYKLPITLFLTTGYLDQRREFWWDEFEQFIMQPRKLPEILTIDRCTN